MKNIIDHDLGAMNTEQAAIVESQGADTQRPEKNVNESCTASDAGAASDGRPEDTGDEDNDMDDTNAEEEDESFGPDAQGKVSCLSAKQKMRHALTGRGVTLAMLMDDKLIEPGENVMSIEYLGQKFTGDLLADSRIRWREENKIFGSPSAWALHCKKIVNPAKKSGCGWASVRYKGRKLDVFKSSWVRKQKPMSSLATHSFDGVKEELDDLTENEEENKKIKLDTEEEASDMEAEPRMHAPIIPTDKKMSIRYAALGRRSHHNDPSTMIECHTFTELGKLQPFSIRLHSNCLLMIDFHSHLTTGEIVGYIAGKWDANTQYLSLEKAYPCKCRLWDLDNAANTENEIRMAMEKAGLVLAGWYHSHPYNQPDPSLQDIETQMHYQLNMKGSNATYQPCVALISSPYNGDKNNVESHSQCYWVMPPHEQRPFDYGMPMTMQYEYVQDTTLSDEHLKEMSSLVCFYRGEPDEIHMKAAYSPNTTFLAKLLGSLHRKLPRESSEGHIKDQIQQLFNN